jgi:hypothetical protein
MNNVGCVYCVFYVVIDDEQGLEHRRASRLQYMNNRLSTKVSIVDYFKKKSIKKPTNNNVRTDFPNDPVNSNELPP